MTRTPFLDFFLRVTKALVIIVVIMAIINFFTQRIRVTGLSMMPNFLDCEAAIVNRLAYKNTLPRRGDVIVFTRPPTQIEPSKEVIKRVIGLPGEHIQIHNGATYINGVKLDEPYLNEPMAGSGDWVLPPDAIFVMGDNRNHSFDSRAWGPLNLSQIIGKVEVIYYPFSSARIVQPWRYGDRQANRSTVR